VLAVLDTADCERATLFDLGESSDGSMTAATHPDRVRTLIFVRRAADLRERCPRQQQALQAVAGRTFTCVQEAS
jgi:hypothetical protein